MDKKELLNEEEYLKNKNKLKKVGKILLIVGGIVAFVSIIFIIVGLILFGNSAMSTMDIVEDESLLKGVAGGALGGMGLFTIGSFGLTFGIFLASIGGIVMFIAHRREITSFTVQQTMPIAQEGIEKMTPTIANAAGSISKSVSKGIVEGKNEANKN